MPSRYLINATTLVHGGGLQVGVSVIRHALEDRSGPQWTAIVSPQIFRELQATGLDLSAGVIQAGASPARCRRARARLAEQERDLAPDAVLTVFGPAYVNFRAPHVMGVADGWVTHSTLLAYRSLRSPWAAAGMALGCGYKTYWFRKADAWWVEAESARLGLQRRLRLPPSRVDVLHNTCASAYLRDSVRRAPPPEAQTVRLLTFATGSAHKNLMILPSIASELAKNVADRQFEFVVTLPADGAAWRALQRRAERLQVSQLLRNVGPVPIDAGPALYQQADICLAPSLLETSSAVYPEAMAMSLPIVATDLPFAREACGDAALYYSPLSARDAARQVARVCESPSLWNQLTARGEQRLAMQPSPDSRFTSLRSRLDTLSRAPAAPPVGQRAA